MPWPPPGRRLPGRVLGGTVPAWGNSTTRCRVAGGGPDVPLLRAAPPPGPAVVIPEPPLRVLTAGRWTRAGGSPPESVHTNPRPARHARRTTRGQLDDLAGHPRDARPQTSRRSWKTRNLRTADARRESPNSSDAEVRSVCNAW